MQRIAALLSSVTKYALMVALTFFLASTPTSGQQQAKTNSPQVPVIMLSDLHFDSLQDPDKVLRLDKLPVREWRRILDAPASPNQAPRFAAIQKACNGKEGTDTPYALLRSSLMAAKDQAPSASFVMVSGDLLVHDLDCRYRASMGLPANTTDDESISASFAEKTTVFVMNQIESTFPRVPVYIALGNNDSRCNHNRLSSHDDYLKASAAAVVEGLRGVTTSEKALALSTYESAGYYGVNMPAPMKNTRLLVIDDIYMMPKYANCAADSSDRVAEQEQTAWLHNELEKAKEEHQRVWVLGHLPPVVNPDASLSEAESFCTSGKVVRFQTSNDLADNMMSSETIIKLGVFGHTHMDELHLLPGNGGGVPIKVIGSVSPVSGNLPSFTVGLVDLPSATLADYTVYEASNATGLATRWVKEYSFDETYGEANFSPASLADLIGKLRADPTAVGTDSRSYQEHFFKGSDSKKLSPSWPGYVCGLDNPKAKSFKACVCGEH